MKKPFNLTFTVGPTQISAEVQADARYAFDNNLLSVSHRSKEFTEMSKFTIEQLRAFLDIPQNYEIFFTSSSTECWEICARNLVEKEAFSFANGHFSHAFAKCLKTWGKKCVVDTAAWGTLNKFKQTDIPKTAELITLAHNETSTGVTCSMDDIKHLRNKYPDKFLAVDITSSVGCTAYNITDADVWYFSVQKGIGLPSGLGVMIVSTPAIERSKELLKAQQPQGFFNFSNMQAQMSDAKFQTVSTPNILAIYLLGQQIKRFHKIGCKALAEKTINRAEDIYTFFEKHQSAKPFVSDKSYRSPYTICIEMNEGDLKQYQQKAANENVQLGGGYGKLKGTCMRIANYNAISDDDMKKLFLIFS